MPTLSSTSGDSLWMIHSPVLGPRSTSITICACGLVFSKFFTVPESVTSFFLSNITKEWCANAGAAIAPMSAAKSGTANLVLIATSFVLCFQGSGSKEVTPRAVAGCPLSAAKPPLAGDRGHLTRVRFPPCKGGSEHHQRRRAGEGSFLKRMCQSGQRQPTNSRPAPENAVDLPPHDSS